MTYVAVAEGRATGPEPRPGRETKGERTRRRLLEEAVRSFGEQGFRGTSVSSIARTVGLTQAAAYAYFDSKTDLYRAAVDADAESLIDGAREPLQGLSVREMLPALVALLVAGLEHHPLARRVVSGHDAESLDRLIELPGFVRVGEELGELLAAEQATGAVRADVDPAVLARGIQAILFGLVMSSAQISGPPRPEMIEGVVHALDAIVRPPDGA